VLPRALIGDNEIIGSVIHVDDDAEFAITDDDKWIVLRLQPGMETSITKSCQAMVVAQFPGDVTPKRIEIVSGV
jgi:hypothetical protein